MVYRFLNACGRLTRLAVNDRGGSHRLHLRFLQTLPPDICNATENTSSLSLLPQSSVGVNGAETVETSTQFGVGCESPIVGNEGVVEADHFPFCSGMASEQVLQAFTGSDFPFKLYGEDPRASVTDANRVFSSTSFNSYDPIVFCSGESIIRGEERYNGERADIQQPSECDVDEDLATAESVAAAAVAMTVNADVKVPDHVHSIYFHPPPLPPSIPQQQEKKRQSNSELGRIAPHSFSEKGVVRETRSQKTSGVENSNGDYIGMDVEKNENEQQKFAYAKESDEPEKEGDLGGVRIPSLIGTGGGEVRVVVRDHMRNSIDINRLLSFTELLDKLPPWLQQGISREGYTVPSLVQSVSIPLLMEKRDVVVVAPTGSGKTVAFALPALAGLAALYPLKGEINKNRWVSLPVPLLVTLVEPHVLVLCPTRELVQQTRRVFSNLCGNAVNVKGIFGGQHREQQLEYLRRQGGCDVLVATPGRLCDFVEEKMVSLRMIDFLIMDEADRMLELGFAPQLEFIMSNIKSYKRARQTTMWTATWNATVGNLATRFMLSGRVVVEVDRSNKINTDITQKIYPIQDASQRVRAIVRLYDKGVITKRQQVLVFANRKEVVEQLAVDLRKALRAPPGLLQFLHGGMKQRKREAVLNGFKDGVIRILCASDVAARGLDVPTLDHVINFDLPGDTDAYVHRIGRTGRAGRHGIAHTLIHKGDVHAPLIARFIAAQTGNALPDDVLAIVRDVELHGGGVSSVNNKYKSHARMTGRDWRIPGAENPTSAQSSRFVRGVGRVVTLKRPT